ncbi:Erv41 protein [Starmerella bacillaris]|uniref:Endoplasmic reticulum-Golgi intermediate compartment protein n=1 Tax=Starmerella bacillaris TaxID=1247836 RepID=A0AAV5RN22_STABA|nr:Erv41 protein [Starmerella bacillaris]
MVDLRSFDAYTKVHDSYQVNTNQIRAAVHNGIFAVVAIFILYLQTSSWMGAKPEFKFDVARGIIDTFTINLDIVVMSPCQMMGVFVEDVSGDRLYVNELITSTNIDAKQLMPSLRTSDEDLDWCRITGSFDANRVAGKLSIVPLNRFEAFNASHNILELSFGQFIPQLVNPLDMTRQLFEEDSSISYFMSIFPTTVRAFGQEIVTNQYSVARAVSSSDLYKTPAGIHFAYDFEPISIEITDDRISFLAWACRVVNIVGGVLFVLRIIRPISKRDIIKDNKGILG